MNVYRICESDAWARARREGTLPLSDIDRRDGYVHLSTAAQVPSTLHRFFAGRGDLVLLTIACERLTEGAGSTVLEFEAPSHAPDERGELFPHLYGRLTLAAIVSAEALGLDEHGQHRLPAGLVRAIAAAP